MVDAEMVVIAGPPGSGKSRDFPLANFGVDYFNADDRAAELNQGSYKNISMEIRAVVNREFEKWILDHIAKHKSFAFETTLRTSITFEQARFARSHGFRTAMFYVCAGSIGVSIRRVIRRSYLGGHAASDRLLREIYDKSIRNLLVALDFGESGIEAVRVYDSSQFGQVPRKLMTVRNSQITMIIEDIPSWLGKLLKGTKFDPQ